MKDRWKFCQCCYLNGHCENQDRDMKCENYSNQLEDKVERLQEQLNEANECIKDKYLWTCSACSLLGSCMSCGNRYFGRYIKKWGVK